MKMVSGCGHAERGKSTLMEDGSAGMKGSGDHGCGEDVHYGRPREEAGVQADVTGCSSACWRRVRGWGGTK